MKPIWIIIAVLIALVGVTVLNGSDLLSGGTCYRIAAGFGASSATVPAGTGFPGAVAPAGSAEAVSSATAGSKIAAAKDQRTCDVLTEQIGAGANDVSQNGDWVYNLDTFTGFRSLILILPLIIVALIIYGAWRSGHLGGSRGAMGY